MGLFEIDTPGKKMESFFQGIGGQLVNRDNFANSGVLFKGHYDGYNYVISKEETSSIFSGKVKVAAPGSVNVGGWGGKDMSVLIYTFEIPLRKQHAQVSVCQFRKMLLSVISEVEPEGAGNLPKFEKIINDYVAYAATEQEASAFIALAQQHGFLKKIGMFTASSDYSVELLPDKLLILATTLNEANFKGVIALATAIDSTLPGSALPAPMPSTPPAPTPPPAP